MTCSNNANSNVCCGCFTNYPFPFYNPCRCDQTLSVPTYKTPMPMFVPVPAEGLTSTEKEVLRLLSEAWNVFVNLDDKHPDDDDEFRRAIHDAQKTVALRVARRIDTDVWKQPEPKDQI